MNATSGYSGVERDAIEAVEVRSRTDDGLVFYDIYVLNEFVGSETSHTIANQLKRILSHALYNFAQKSIDKYIADNINYLRNSQR